jgi:hypothetical protein
MRQLVQAHEANLTNTQYMHIYQTIHCNMIVYT